MKHIPYFKAAAFDCLTEDMLQAYERDGVLVLEDMVPIDECNSLMNRMSELVDDFMPSKQKCVFSSITQEQQSDQYFLESSDSIRFFFEEGAFNSEGEVLADKSLTINKVGHALHDKDDVFNTFSRQKGFETIVRGLGMQAPLLMQSMYIFKQPHIGGEVLCHQDSPYLWTEPASCIGLWVALEDATLDNGCLWGIAGSHKEKQPRARLSRTGDYTTTFDVLDDTPWPEDERVPLEVKAGTLIVLHGQFPHLSGPNNSDKSRHAYALHLVDGACDYPAANWLQRPDNNPARGFSQLMKYL